MAEERVCQLADSDTEGTKEQMEEAGLSRREFLSKGAKGAALLGAATLGAYVAPTMTQLTMPEAFAVSPGNCGDKGDRDRDRDRDRDHDKKHKNH